MQGEFVGTTGDEDGEEGEDADGQEGEDGGVEMDDD